jgi:hypothetical protein
MLCYALTLRTQRTSFTVSGKAEGLKARYFVHPVFQHAPQSSFRNESHAQIRRRPRRVVANVAVGLDLSMQPRE